MARTISAGSPQAAASGAHQSRIGPNAITRIAEALTARLGGHECRSVFGAAGLLHHLSRPPTDMVPDEDVARLHCALAGELGSDLAHEIGAEAGRLTAIYLLENRIPRFARVLLSLLPARLALRFLLKAIASHAWTFAGAGTFSYQCRRETTLAIRDGPVSRYRRCETPVCSYYAATFETLFRAIISRRIDVLETACEAQGADACLFTVTLP